MAGKLAGPAFSFSMACRHRGLIRMTSIRLSALLLAALLACMPGTPAFSAEPAPTSDSPEHKLVIFQAFSRLFGNKQSANIPWGTVEQNGVGKFADFDDTALQSIKQLGASHIWYTGVPHHALVGDYRAYGIGSDDPDVVKGRAGSPYAVKDYYNVNPDLANDPAQRLQEFKALARCAGRHP